MRACDNCKGIGGDLQESKVIRPSLTGALVESLRDRILHGRLSAQNRLAEAELAEELGVSRTPLREALVALEGEGFVNRIPNRGFFVVPLSGVEAQELYPLMGGLESLALRSQESADADILHRLEARNQELMSGHSKSVELLSLDSSWHELLLSRCANSKILELVERVRNLLYRYEYAFMAEAGVLATSVRQHANILVALRLGDTRQAAILLEEHWTAGAPALAAWLQREEASSS